MDKHPYQSNFVRQYFTQKQAETSQAEGENRGKAQAILLVLEARGMPASEPLRRAVLGCSDGLQLDAWIRAAATTDRAGSLLGEVTNEAKASEAKPAEAKVSEAKASEAKAAEAKPAEAKPVEAKPVEAKPVEAKPAEAKPAETKPAEARPAEEGPSAEAEAAVVAVAVAAVAGAPPNGVGAASGAGGKAVADEADGKGQKAYGKSKGNTKRKN